MAVPGDEETEGGFEWFVDDTGCLSICTGSELETAMAKEGPVAGGRHTAVRFGLVDWGRRLGRLSNMEARLDLGPPGLGDLLVDLGEVEEDWLGNMGWGAITAISPSSGLGLEETPDAVVVVEVVRASTAESRTEGTDWSRASLLCPRAVRCGSGWVEGAETETCSMSRSKMAEVPEWLKNLRRSEFEDVGKLKGTDTEVGEDGMDAGERVMRSEFLVGDPREAGKKRLEGEINE